MSQPNKSTSGCCSCHGEEEQEFNLKTELIPILLVVLLLLIGLIATAKLKYLIFIPTYLLAGWPVLTTAGRNLFRGKIFDENFLMTVATLGALAIGELPEAVAVMLFFRIGELFQELAVSRSRRSIKSLLEIRPDYANLKIGQEIKQVAPQTVKVGNIILVKPGEKIPLDGIIREGDSQLDTSALTGESIPRRVKLGERVLAGTINQTGVLTIEVTKAFGESSIARILDLVQNASQKKARTEKLMTRLAKVYTPLVVFASLAIAWLPPLLIPGATTTTWIYRALILLVISCPCGLVISIPLGYFGGVGGAAKRGILVKGAMFLDTLKQVKTVVFDKTGTLTRGVFKVTEIITANGYRETELISLAAHAELYSNHPVAKSIKEAYNGTIEADEVKNSEEIAGYGVKALIKGQRVVVGNESFLERENIKIEPILREETVVHVAVDGSYAGTIVIADEIKEDAASGIKALKNGGIEQTVMLTGDNQGIATKVAQQLGIDTWFAELLPEDKVSILEKILGSVATDHKVAFVGDGINDAPVIARADVGIGMGGLGSDAAIETADVVIMSDAPSKVAEAIQVGKKTHSIVWQNIIFALSIKTFFIFLGVLGVATMWEAVFADVGVALLSILNATRALR